MSLFELIEAPHRAHNAKNVNCRINLSQFGYQPPPHLKYIPTLPCNLSLMACFADTNVSQGSVATYARCGGIFNMHLTANLRRNLPVKVFNRLRFDRIMVVSLWPYLFWPTLYSLLHVSWGQSLTSLLRFVDWICCTTWSYSCAAVVKISTDVGPYSAYTKPAENG